MKIVNLTQNTIISNNATLADTFFSRTKGLLGRKSLDKDEALIITNCNSIHMFFMQFSIDVIFVDKKNRVVKLIENIKPWRITPIFWQANFAIEVNSGTIKISSLHIGDKLQIL